MQKQKEQGTKENLIRTLVIEVAKNSKYSKSIFKKYAKMGDEYATYSNTIQSKSQKLIGEILIKEDFKGITQDKLIKYMQEDKMPPKLRADILALKGVLINLVNTEVVKYPMFNWYEIRSMQIGLVDLLNTYGLIDKRYIMCFFKQLYKEI